MLSDHGESSSFVFFSNYTLFTHHAHSIFDLLGIFEDDLYVNIQFICSKKPKALVDNQKLLPGCPWDNHCVSYFLIRALFWNMFQNG